MCVKLVIYKDYNEMHGQQNIEDYFIILEVFEVPSGRAVNPKLKLVSCCGVQICCMVYIFRSVG